MRFLIKNYSCSPRHAKNFRGEVFNHNIVAPRGAHLSSAKIGRHVSMSDFEYTEDNGAAETPGRDGRKRGVGRRGQPRASPAPGGARRAGGISAGKKCADDAADRNRKQRRQSGGDCTRHGEGAMARRRRVVWRMHLQHPADAGCGWKKEEGGRMWMRQRQITVYAISCII